MVHDLYIEQEGGPAVEFSHGTLRMLLRPLFAVCRALVPLGFPEYNSNSQEAKDGTYCNCGRYSRVYHLDWWHPTAETLRPRHRRRYWQFLEGGVSVAAATNSFSHDLFENLGLGTLPGELKVARRKMDNDPVLADKLCRLS